MNTITLTLSNFNVNSVLSDVDEGFLGIIIVEAIRVILATANPNPIMTMEGEKIDPFTRSLEYLDNVMTGSHFGQDFEGLTDDEETQVELDDENYTRLIEKLTEVINELAQANDYDTLLAVEPYIEIMGIPKYPSVSASYFKNKVVLCLM